MSSYEYTENDGTKLIARPSSFGSELWLSLGDSRAKVGMYLPITEVPTFAAELLKAAGVEATILPKTTAKVSYLGGLLECGARGERVQALETYNPANLRTQAANTIALAEWIEGAPAREAAEKAEAEAEAEAAEKKLQERRDEAAQGFSPYSSRYNAVSVTAQAAIDAYLETEDKLASRD